MGGNNEKAIGNYFAKSQTTGKRYLVTKAALQMHRIIDKLVSLQRMNTYIDMYFIHYLSDAKGVDR
jgi:aryl-alcohol dehydrogenase-like predicted oxidoreductase